MTFEFKEPANFSIDVRVLKEFRKLAIELDKNYSQYVEELMQSELIKHGMDFKEDYADKTGDPEKEEPELYDVDSTGADK